MPPTDRRALAAVVRALHRLRGVDSRPPRHAGVLPTAWNAVGRQSAQRGAVVIDLIQDANLDWRDLRAGAFLIS